RPARQDLGEEPEAVHARHLDIGDDGVVLALADALERAYGRVDRIDDDLAHPQPQRLGKRLQEGRVVVDDENALRAHGADAACAGAQARGSWRTNVAPSPGRLSTQIVPPASLTMP